MTPLTHIKEVPSTSTQTVVFEFATLEDLHGVLYLLEFREEYLFTEIRSFYKVPDEKKLLVHFQMRNPTQNPDFSWERRLKYLFRYMLDLEKLMWNLSTLGGAYSAMGDFDTDYAKTAARITAHQITLAKKYGDPVILARCYLYTALAEAQLGRLSLAVNIVKAVRYWAKNNPNTEIVQRCCEGVYQKLRAIHMIGIAGLNK
uniref:FERM domain-containing protein n=1 Tax=Caenorhabditis tropicalis TaxID=1561998 RepID=A0A1I7UHB5_9PELO